MSEVKAFALVDYRVKTLRKFIERLYSECNAEGMGIQWAGYSTSGIGDSDNTFFSGDFIVHFDGKKYDELTERLGVRKLGSFKIVMIDKEKSPDDSKIRVLYCVPDAVLAHRLMKKVSKAASKNRMIGRPMIRSDDWDVVDILLTEPVSSIIEFILELLSMI